MKQLLVVFFCCVANLATAQKVVYQHTYTKDDALTKYSRNYRISNQFKEEIVIIHGNKKGASVSVFNDDVSQPTQFTVPGISGSDFSKYVGSGIQGSTYHLYFANNGYRTLGVISVDVATQTMHDTTLSQQLPDNERFVLSFMHQNKCWLMTTTYETSMLNFYALEDTELRGKHTVDFAEYSFHTKGDVLVNRKSLDQLFKSFKPVLIDYNIPQLPGNVQADFKVYLHGNELYITSDRQKGTTKVMVVDLNTFSSHVANRPYAEITCGSAETQRGVSYLHKGRLFQLHICNMAMDLSAYTIADTTLIKSYRVYNNQALAFNNTPVIQKGVNSTKRLNDITTKQLLKKINDNSLFLLINEMNDSAIVSLGSYFFEVSRTGVIDTYSSMGFRSKKLRQISFNSVFNSNTLEHIPGTLNSNRLAYEKTISLLDENYLHINTFKLYNKIYLAYYVKKSKRYIIKEFK